MDRSGMLLLLLLQLLLTLTIAAATAQNTADQELITQNVSDVGPKLARRCLVSEMPQSLPKRSAMRSRWRFEDGACRWFPYYGARLYSGNVFMTKAECNNFCVSNVTDPCKSAVCKQNWETFTGECVVKRDVECETLVYARLGVKQTDATPLNVENANNLIEQHCLPPTAVCKMTGINGLRSFEMSAKQQSAPQTPDFCRLPRDSGRCQPGQKVRRRPMYYYRQLSNECKFMMHFGCEGNENRFSSLADCYNTCGV